MVRPLIIGVMGPGGGAGEKDLKTALELGAWIGSQGWVLISGGRKAGVIAMVNRGARKAGGLTLGFLPGSRKGESSDDVLIPIPTDLGNARNNINVLACDILVAIAFRIGAGTVSEIALAIKAKKPILLITNDALISSFFTRLGLKYVRTAASIREALDQLPAMAALIVAGKKIPKIHIARDNTA